MFKALRSLERVPTYLAGLSIVLMMCMTVADAGGRYLFNHPVTGAYEITENFLMTVAFLGVYYAYRQGAHIRLTFLMDHVPHKIEIYINYLVQTICVGLTLVLVIATTKLIFRTAAQKTVIDVASLKVPLWTAYTIIPLGLFFTFLAMLVDFRYVKTGKSDLFKKGESESDR